METEQRRTIREELNDKLRDTLAKALEEIAQQFGDRYKVSFFHYKGGRSTNYLPVDLFYFQRDHKKFRNFAQDFFALITFPISQIIRGGLGQETVQVWVNFNMDELPFSAAINDRRYEQIVRKHLDKFALQNNRTIDYC